MHQTMGKMTVVAFELNYKLLAKALLTDKVVLNTPTEDANEETKEEETREGKGQPASLRQHIPNIQGRLG